jgi:DNA repair protein RecO (recombination protein O)
VALREQLQPAWLLHRRPFRDSSQLLEFFTLDHGRLGLVARGVSRRRRGGPLTALLQPFRPLLVSFTLRGDLGSLTGVEAGGETLAPVGERLFSALYLNELLTRCLPRQEEQAGLFAAYGRALEDLAGEALLEPALRRLEFTLLEALGYAVDLRCDGASGDGLDPQAHYRLERELGFVPVVGEAPQEGLLRGRAAGHSGRALRGGAARCAAPRAGAPAAAPRRSAAPCARAVRAAAGKCSRAGRWRMSLAIGTDLVEVARVERIWHRQGERFCRRILTPEECERCLALREPWRFLAKRFAAKEAIAKCLGVGIGTQLGWQDIQIGNTAAGEPQVCLSPRGQALAARRGGQRVLLSLSDERAYALAFAVLVA